MPHILFAEDEEVLGQLIKEAIEHEPGFTVDWYRDGEAAVVGFTQSRPQLCVLDVMMPLLDGFQTAKEIRAIDKSVPILFLTARAQTADVVKGFDSGGDDYLRKPFSVEELLARIKALLRRAGTDAQRTTDDTELFTIGSYSFSPASQVLRCPHARYTLTSRETELLREFVLQKNTVVNRKDVLLKLWGDDSFFNGRSMDVYISKLRKYLSHDPSVSILNVRGYGYKLAEEK